MGLFIKKSVKSYLERGKLATSYILAACCLLLVAVNVAAFMYFKSVELPVALVLSNAITVILMLLAFRPVNNLMQKSFEKKARELADTEAHRQQLTDRVVSLENRNRELESRIDTWNQTATVAPNLQMTFKVETMTYDKSGYVVKEEPLDRFLSDPAYKLPDKNDTVDRIATWVSDLIRPGKKKVLYIGKYYVKASIGIDFSKIRYAVDEYGDLTLYGVQLAKLNDLAIKRDPGDVNYCWLLSEDGGNITINKSELYADFVKIYAGLRAEETSRNLESEVEALCRNYTEAFRSNLKARFPGLKFCDRMEDIDTTWYSLKENTGNPRIQNVAANIFLMADALGEYLSGRERVLEK